MAFRTWLTGRPYQPPYRMAYTTRALIKAQISTTETVADADIDDKGYAASAIFSSETQRCFVPFIQSAPYDWVNHTTLHLDDDLMTLTSVTDSTGALSAGEYVLKSNNRNPYSTIQTLGSRKFTFSTNRESAITVAGVWGFHPNPSIMWAAQTTITVGVATVGATSITVGSTTNISVLSYLKIDDEYLLVTAITGLVLTVERGVNGSTAATHLINVVVYLYQQNPEIQRAVTHLAVYLYLTQNTFNEVYATVGGEVSIAKQIPDYVIGIINRYKSGRKR